MDSVTWTTWVQVMGSPMSTAQLWRRTQERLVALGQMGRAHVSGAPNPATTRALQKMAGFPQTGVWDDATDTDGVAALQTVMWQIATNQPPKPTPAPPWPLPKTHRIGPNPKGYATWHDGHSTDTMGRAALKKWQTQMLKRGWNLGPGSVDGQWGPYTAAAFDGLKTQWLIPENGLGPRVWEAAWATPIR